MREKRYILVIHIIIFGITPACAGKTGHAHDVTRKAWDHPRVCGKNKNPCNPQEYHLGSPPRVREKLLAVLAALAAAGITPACAGKTEIVDYADNMEPGSPPRVREKPKHKQHR